MSLGFRTFSVLIGAAGVTLLSGGAADATGNAKRGQQIAEKWCASCHQIAPGAMSFDESRPATFQEIADHPAIDESTLKTFFQAPHHQMPNFSVTDEVRDHLIAYIISLKHR
jgi:mono/diheme cytochrome c family protein